MRAGDRKENMKQLQLMVILMAAIVMAGCSGEAEANPEPPEQPEQEPSQTDLKNYRVVTDGKEFMVQGKRGTNWTSEYYYPMAVKTRKEAEDRILATAQERAKPIQPAAEWYPVDRPRFIIGSHGTIEANYFTFTNYVWLTNTHYVVSGCQCLNGSRIWYQGSDPRATNYYSR